MKSVKIIFFTLAIILFTACKAQSQDFIKSWKFNSVLDLETLKEKYSKSEFCYKCWDLVTINVINDNKLILGFEGTNLIGNYIIKNNILTITAINSEGETKNVTFEIDKLSSKTLILKHSDRRALYSKTSNK